MIQELAYSLEIARDIEAGTLAGSQRKAARFYRWLKQFHATEEEVKALLTSAGKEWQWKCDAMTNPKRDDVDVVYWYELPAVVVAFGFYGDGYIIPRSRVGEAPLV